jgi:RNA polymerase sigma-70 factor (ECF subfamily)
VVAETFERVLGGAPPPDGVSARAWLFSVARHVAIDETRARARRAPLEAAATAAAAPAGPDPERDAAGRAELSLTLRDLQDLPEEARAALLLRVQDGLDYHEIGAALSCSPVAARVRVHRARSQLAALRAAREETP